MVVLARIGCVLAGYLPVQVEQRRRKLDLPLLIPHPVDGSVIFACSPEAEAAGIYAGLSLYQARQMLPQALVIEPDEPAYHAAHGAMEAALRDFSPLIETVGLGEFLVDLRGVAGWGSTRQRDEALAQELQRAVAEACGLRVRVGLATGKFVAERAARAQAGDEDAGVLVVPAGEEGRFLAPMPVAVLPNLPGEMRRRLFLFDLHTLGDLAALRKPAVLRQFGGEMAGLYELACGHDPRPVNPDVPPLRLVRTLRFSSPVSERQPLLNAAQRLSWQLSKTLTHRGYHAEGIKLTLHLADGTAQEAGQAAKPPTSDEARLARLVGVLLGRLPVKTPVAAVALSVYPLRAWHIGLHQLKLAGAGVPEKQLKFESALQLLIHRFGQAVVRVAALLGPPVALHIQVELDGEGLPQRLAFGGQTRFVQKIDERWREERQWWDERQALRRDYFRVMLLDDSLRNIFQDLTDNEWYLDRSWPVL
jgi:DNA polymerase IV